MSEYKIIREYKVTIEDGEAVEEYLAARDLSFIELVDGITRMSDKGDLTGQLFLISATDGGEDYWDDNPGEEDKIMYTVQYEVEETDVNEE